MNGRTYSLNEKAVFTRNYWHVLYIIAMNVKRI